MYAVLLGYFVKYLFHDFMQRDKSTSYRHLAILTYRNRLPDVPLPSTETMPIAWPLKSSVLVMSLECFSASAKETLND